MGHGVRITGLFRADGCWPLTVTMVWQLNNNPKDFNIKCPGCTFHREYIKAKGQVPQHNAFHMYVVRSTVRAVRYSQWSAVEASRKRLRAEKATVVMP
jgi:hypothetical protein